MNREPYLWDKSGPEAPFVAKLERLLATKRAEVMQAGRRRRPRLLRRGAWLLVATAAGIVIWVCIAIGTGGAQNDKPTAPPLAVQTAPLEANEAASPTQPRDTEKAARPEPGTAQPALDALADPAATRSR